jgi:hypothetical protein
MTATGSDQPARRLKEKLGLSPMYIHQFLWQIWSGSFFWVLACPGRYLFDTKHSTIARYYVRMTAIK